MFYKFLKVFIYQMFGKIILLGIGVYLAKELGPEVFGEYVFLSSIFMILTTISLFGTPTFILREVPRLLSDKKSVKSLVFWSTVIIVSFSIIWLLVFVFYYGFIEDNISLVFLFVFFIIPCRAIIILQSSIINALGFVNKSQISLSIVNPLSLIFLFVIIGNTEYELNINSTLAVFSFSLILSCIISSILTYDSINSFRNEKANVISMYNLTKSCFPFAMLMIVAILNTEFSILIIKWLGSEDILAFLRVGTQYTTALGFVLISLNVVISPNLARSIHTNNWEEAQKILNKSVNISFLISTPIIILAFFYSDELIDLIYGAEYSKSSLILKILLVGQLINVSFGSLATALNMLKLEKEALKASVITAIVTSILLFITVPIFGAAGAASCISFSMFLINILMARVLLINTKLSTWIKIP